MPTLTMYQVDAFADRAFHGNPAAVLILEDWLPEPVMLPASKDQLHSLFDYLEAALEARGYFRPKAKKPKMVDNLRAVLTRAGFAEPELKVLRGIISSLDRFSPAMPRGDGSPGDDPRRLPAAAVRARKAEASGQAHDTNSADNDAPPLGGKGTDND